MFINTIKEFIKKVIGMFNKDTMQKTMNVDVAISNDMQNAIELWTYIYENNAPWVDKKKVFSMNLGAGIASEFAKLVTIEFKSEISNNDFLNKEYQKLINKIRNATEFATAKGGVVFKPYISNGHIPIDIVQADNFYPTAYNSNGEITGAIFPDTKIVGDDTYTRVEYHNFSNNGTYTIINKAFKKKNYNSVNISADTGLGDEIPLTDVEEWSDLIPQIIFNGVERPLFSYFKMPMANRIDTSSPLGTSVFERIADVDGGLLRKVDEQYSRILWEYEGSELAVHADMTVFKKDERGNSVLPIGSDRLYRSLDIDHTAGEGKALDVFSPEIRDSALFNGLNKLLQQVEFLVGLAKGTISDIVETDKTATEVKSSKQRSYQTVKDIQNSLQTSLENLIYGMSYYGQVAKLPVTPVDLENDVSYDFDDSIIVDHEAEIQSMQTDVSLGILDRTYYIMKKYNVDEATAKKMIPQETIIKPDPFQNTEE
jgi:A118 family predicted phage portal protein